ncbi:hypothetical protein [Demequina sediminicola]|uniref:hypothetical protein n=1 Tax=Demequina sediminicola TaxID=1095026 RepID=UPI000780D2DB|nr:hypothetical protein [Demequina sediminicola]
MATLSDADVVHLRERYAAGERQVDLARDFQIAQTTVSALVSGRIRAAAGGPLATPQRARAPRSKQGAAKKRTRITDAVVAEVKERVAAGESRVAVAQGLGISKASVDSIMSGRRGGASASRRSGSLDSETRERIRAAHAAGTSQSAIARDIGTSQQMVSKVLRTTEGSAES